MARDAALLLEQQAVRVALAQAWEDSLPGVTGGHEEGGFIVRDDSVGFSTSRWPIGVQNSIALPPHSGCRISGRDIVASFHAHPNTGPDYLQEPSETDRRSIRDDPELKGPLYAGEFVITHRRVYLVETNGQVNDLVETACILREI